MNEIFAWFMALLSVFGLGHGADQAQYFNGYIEADFVYAAAASAGRIDALDAKEGETIAAGALLFQLENEQQAALLRAATARMAAAEANWRNLETGGRVEEIAVIRASLDKAKADLTLAKQNLGRSMQLQKQGVVSVAKVEADQALATATEAQVAQLTAQLHVAELPARDAQLVSASATLDAARAEVEKAQADLDNRAVSAPVSGLVERVYFRSGEVVGAGTPVVALLPPGAKKVRFFIPEAQRALFQPGQKLAVACDNCGDGLVAVISRMASDPQYTPPIIFSREERGRLVFAAEARLDGEVSLMPGQPVTVEVLQ